MRGWFYRSNKDMYILYMFQTVDKYVRQSFLYVLKYKCEKTSILSKLYVVLFAFYVPKRYNIDGQI